MSDLLGEALAWYDKRRVICPWFYSGNGRHIVAAARNWHTLTKRSDGRLMRIFGSVDDLKHARKQLGSPAAQALVVTGIDALFLLLDGGSIEIEGRRLTLVDALTVTAEEAPLPPAAPWGFDDEGER